MFSEDYFGTGPYKQSYVAKPTSELIPVITKSELADYLRLDDASDRFLQQVSLAATQALINQLQTEIVARQRVVIYPNYPTFGTSNGRGLSASRQAVRREIELPYARLISVERVENYGAEVMNYEIKNTTPASIELDSITVDDNDEPALAINYTAGFGNIEDVPLDLKFACTMLAAYIYDNRGCTMQQAFVASGAKEMSQSYSYGVLVL